MPRTLLPTPCQKQPLHALEEPDHVALGIGEQADRRAVGHRHRAHHARAAQALCLGERRLDVIDADVEGRGAASLLSGADADADGVVDHAHAVVHLVVGVQLPAEQRREEFLQLGAVLAGDLEMCNWTAHAFSSWFGFGFALGSGPASPPAAAMTRRDRYMSQPAPWASAAPGVGRPVCTRRTIVPSPSGVKVISTVLEPGGVSA